MTCCRRPNAPRDLDFVAGLDLAMRLGGLAVDVDLAALAGLLRLGARLEQAGHVEPDVETNGHQPPILAHAAPGWCGSAPPCPWSGIDVPVERIADRRHRLGRDAETAELARPRNDAARSVRGQVCLSADIGSSCAARRAGIHVAAIATQPKNSVTAA